MQRLMLPPASSSPSTDARFLALFDERADVPNSDNAWTNAFGDVQGTSPMCPSRLLREAPRLLCVAGAAFAVALSLGITQLAMSITGGYPTLFGGVRSPPGKIIWAAPQAGQRRDLQQALANLSSLEPRGASPLRAQSTMRMSGSTEEFLIGGAQVTDADISDLSAVGLRTLSAPVAPRGQAAADDEYLGLY